MHPTSRSHNGRAATLSPPSVSSSLSSRRLSRSVVASGMDLDVERNSLLRDVPPRLKELEAQAALDRFHHHGTPRSSSSALPLTARSSTERPHGGTHDQNRRRSQRQRGSITAWRRGNNDRHSLPFLASREVRAEVEVVAYAGRMRDSSTVSPRASLSCHVEPGSNSSVLSTSVPNPAPTPAPSASTNMRRLSSHSSSLTSYARYLAAVWKESGALASTRTSDAGTNEHKLDGPSGSVTAHSPVPSPMPHRPDTQSTSSSHIVSASEQKESGMECLASIDALLRPDSLVHVAAALAIERELQVKKAEAEERENMAAKRMSIAGSSADEIAAELSPPAFTGPPHGNQERRSPMRRRATTSPTSTLSDTSATRSSMARSSSSLQSPRSRRVLAAQTKVAAVTPTTSNMRSVSDAAAPSRSMNISAAHTAACSSAASCPSSPPIPSLTSSPSPFLRSVSQMFHARQSRLYEVLHDVFRAKCVDLDLPWSDVDVDSRSSSVAQEREQRFCSCALGNMAPGSEGVLNFQSQGLGVQSMKAVVRFLHQIRQEPTITRLEAIHNHRSNIRLSRDHSQSHSSFSSETDSASDTSESNPASEHGSEKEEEEEVADLHSHHSSGVTSPPRRWRRRVVHASIVDEDLLARSFQQSSRSSFSSLTQPSSTTAQTSCSTSSNANSSMAPETDVQLSIVRETPGPLVTSQLHATHSTSATNEAAHGVLNSGGTSCAHSPLPLVSNSQQSRCTSQHLGSTSHLPCVHPSLTVSSSSKSSRRLADTPSLDPILHDRMLRSFMDGFNIHRPFHHSFHTLDLSSNPLGDEGAIELAKAFKLDRDAQTAHHNHLYRGDRRSHKRKVGQPSKRTTAQSHVGIRRLVLRSTNLGGRGFSALLDAIATGCLPIEHLDMSSRSSAAAAASVSGGALGVAAGGGMVQSSSVSSSSLYSSSSSASVGHGQMFIGLDGARALSRLLCTPSSLQSLILHSVSLGSIPGAVRLLAVGLGSGSHCLRTLDLSANFFVPNTEFEELAKAFAGGGKRAGNGHTDQTTEGEDAALDAPSGISRHDATLESLNLSYNSIGSAGATMLALALPSCVHLTRLQLDGCNIGGCGLHALTGAFATMGDLCDVSLEKNEFSMHMAMKERKTLPQSMRMSVTDDSLSTASLSRARIISTQLGANVSLQVLHLCRAHIDDKTCAELCSAFANHATLHSLFLSFNLLGESSGPPLANVIRSSPSLEILRLDNNKIGDVAGREIGNAAAQARSLHTIHLQNNRLGDSGGEWLLHALLHPDSPFATVTIDGNAIEYKLYEQITRWGKWKKRRHEETYMLRQYALLRDLLEDQATFIEIRDERDEARESDRRAAAYLRQLQDGIQAHKMRQLGITEDLHAQLSRMKLTSLELESQLKTLQQQIIIANAKRSSQLQLQFHSLADGPGVESFASRLSAKNSKSSHSFSNHGGRGWRVGSGRMRMRESKLKVHAAIDDDDQEYIQLSHQLRTEQGLMKELQGQSRALSQEIGSFIRTLQRNMNMNQSY